MLILLYPDLLWRKKKTGPFFLAENNMVPCTLTKGQVEWTACHCCSLETGSDGDRNESIMFLGFNHGRESHEESCQEKGCDLMNRDTSLKMSILIYFLPTPGDL